MNSSSHSSTTQVIDVAESSMSDFFAPAASDLVESLVAQYRNTRDKLERVAAIVSGEDVIGAMHYFIEGNVPPERKYGGLRPEKVFAIDGAIAALNSAYWSKTLALTDVLEVMPQKRRDEWHEAIRAHTTPDFEEATVRSTVTDLLHRRQQFFAEKVDGLFSRLSRQHVTNSPRGFNSRMIISSAFSQWGSVDHSRAGVIGDLRSVMAKFMGRTPPKYDDTYALLGDLRRTSGTGVWKSFDGGALRIRVYLIGTVHLEIHPDMSWRLNQVLAYLHPAAIPSELRQAPSRKPKNVPLMERPLPFAVLEVIRSMTGDRVKKGVRTFGYGQDKTTVAFSEAKRVLASLGAAVDNVGAQFDYDPSDTIGELIRHGCVPDQISHQFYPTPPLIAADAVALAQIGPDDHVLEPSAGNGDIAALLPSERTTCIEIADLRCSVLKARGLTVKQADFLKWKPEQNEAPITRIVMNPPFADGRAAAHVEHAYSLLQPGGRLVAVLPASFKGKQPVGGDIKWSTIYSNEFHGTSVSVVLMTANKPQ